ncbi:MAG: DUF3006 domain-containing protein [Gemmatimonadota bacterium]|nr:DUF3006 domain-containing protein [Gemmatimonadota bacterium]
MQSDPVRKQEIHSWAIDSIEEHVASVEVDGKAMIQLPQWMLPPAAKEGEVLSVAHEISADGRKSTLAVELDVEATRKAQARSVQTPAKTGKEKVDLGGDIKL